MVWRQDGLPPIHTGEQKAVELVMTVARGKVVKEPCEFTLSRAMGSLWSESPGDHGARSQVLTQGSRKEGGDSPLANVLSSESGSRLVLGTDEATLDRGVQQPLRRRFS